MNLFVKGFRSGKWLNVSNSLLSDKAKVLSLLVQLRGYLQKGGLVKVSGQLKLLAGYINDVIHGRYKKYSASALTLAVAAILYVVSPLDLLPDILPAGFLDDITIVTWALSKLSGELEKYEIWKKDPAEEVSYEEIPDTNPDKLAN